MSTSAQREAGSLLARTRIEALAALARTSEQGVLGLLALLEETSWPVRRDVIAALAALGERALSSLCDSLQHERRSETRIAATVDTLVASDSDVETALSPLGHHENPAVVADVAQILGRRRKALSVPLLINLLTHPDDNVAVSAIEALGRVGGRAAVDALVEIVERDYFFRTYPAIDVLGRSGDPRAVAPLARLLSKPRYSVEAARALGRTADKNAVAPLSGLLISSDSAKVRVGALALAELFAAHRELYGNAPALGETLRQHAGEPAVLRMSHAMTGADASERVALCAVLGAMQLTAAAPELARWLDAEPAVANAAAAALQLLGPEAEEQLRLAILEGGSARRQILLPLLTRVSGLNEVRQCLHDRDPAVRALACDTLARLNDTAVVPGLFALLREDNPAVVQAAMRAIQSLGTAQTQTLAIDAARSTKPSERRAAMRILSYFGYAAAMDVFSDAVHDTDPRVRDVAISGLAFVEHPRARSLLLQAAADASPPVRVAAMRGLGQSTADTEVVAALEVALSDADAWVRYYACQALGKLGVHAAVGAIAGLLSDAAGQVRVAAVESLAQLKSPSALELLGNAATSPEPDVQRAALIGLGMMQSSESLPVLIAACSANDAATRLVALSSLSTFVSQESLAIVARALNDPDEGVRATVLGLLGSWPQTEATLLLVGALRDETLRARIEQALSRPVPGRIAGLLGALQTADDELAPRLIAVLGRIDPDDRTGALFEALRLPNVATRKAAAALIAARATREARSALARQAVEDASEEVRRVCALLLTE